MLCDPEWVYMVVDPLAKKSCRLEHKQSAKTELHNNHTANSLKGNRLLSTSSFRSLFNPSKRPDSESLSEGRNKGVSLPSGEAGEIPVDTESGSSRGAGPRDMMKDDERSRLLSEDWVD